MRAVLVTIMLGCLLLAGCTSMPIYRPASTANDYGYRVKALTDRQYRVSFAAGYGVARETVENLALFRAAQLTLSHGVQRFEVVSTDTGSVSSRSAPMTSIGYGYGYPFWGSGIAIAHSVTRTRYETVLIIDIASDLPDTDPHVYDARQVKHNLAALANSTDT